MQSWRDWEVRKRMEKRMEAIIWEVRLLLQCKKELGMKGNQGVELCVAWSKLLSHSFPRFLFL